MITVEGLIKEYEYQFPVERGMIDFMNGCSVNETTYLKEYFESKGFTRYSCHSLVNIEDTVIKLTFSSSHMVVEELTLEGEHLGSTDFTVYKLAKSYGYTGEPTYIYEEDN